MTQKPFDVEVSDGGRRIAVRNNPSPTPLKEIAITDGVHDVRYMQQFALGILEMCGSTGL